MMFPKWKTMFLSDVFEKCAKDNSKTHFLNLFLSTRRATTRRVNITIVHIKRERNGKNQSLFRGFFLWQKQRDAKNIPKRGLKTQKIAKCFRDHAWKTNEKQKLISKKKKNDKDFFQKQNKKNNDIFELLSETKRIFFRGPKKKIDKRKSRKVTMIKEK